MDYGIWLGAVIRSELISFHVRGVVVHYNGYGSFIRWIYHLVN